MATEFFNLESGRRKLILLLVLVTALILLLAFGGWNLLSAPPEAQATGGCSVMNRVAAHLREV